MKWQTHFHRFLHLWNMRTIWNNNKWHFNFLNASITTSSWINWELFFAFWIYKFYGIQSFSSWSCRLLMATIHARFRPLFCILCLYGEVNHISFYSEWSSIPHKLICMSDPKKAFFSSVLMLPNSVCCNSINVAWSISTINMI